MKMDSLTSVEVRTKSGILAYSDLIFVSSYQSGQIQDCHKVGGLSRLGISVFFDTSIHLIINGYGPKVLGKKKKKKGKRRSLPTPHRPN